METKVYFENIREHIISEIEKAEEEIVIAVAWFTDGLIIKALLEKLDSYIDVKILFYDDKINSKKLFCDLYNNGAKIRCSRTLMHNKFAVIDQSTVINGSYNWTINANENNNENIQITYNAPLLAKKFISEFDKLFDKSKYSDKYFKTREELLEDYLSKQSQPKTYPCFLKVKYNGYLVFILDQKDLRQYYINNLASRKDSFDYHPDYMKYADKNFKKEFIYKIYECEDEDINFIYFNSHTAIIRTENKISKIDRKGNIVKSHTYEKVLGGNLFLFTKDNNKYIINIKMEEIPIPNYFTPSKATIYNNYIILENLSLEAMSDLDGNIILYPYYKKIDIKENIIHCVEYPIFNKGENNKVFWSATIKSTNLEESKNNSAIVEYKICNNRILSSNFTKRKNSEYIYLSDENGIWSEIFMKIRFRSYHYKAIQSAQWKLRNNIKQLHNSKQLINEFITTVDLFNENIIKEYREKREREQRWINMHNSEKELQKKLQKENDKYLFWLVVVIIIIVIISNF